MNEIQVEKTYWASVSGGKDSLKMLHIILENPQNTHLMVLFTGNSKLIMNL